MARDGSGREAAEATLFAKTICGHMQDAVCPAVVRAEVTVLCIRCGAASVHHSI